MNTPHIRHAWFPPAIPKRKHSIELDAESEWPSAYRALSGPAPPVPRPAKRLRGLEGGLAGLTLDVANGWKVEPGPVSASPAEVASAPQVHDNEASISEAEPYISSIYEYASPYPTTTGSSVVSLPLRGEVSEASASDEEKDRERDLGRETVVSVSAQHGMPGYVVYEPEGGLEKRKRGDIEMDEDEMERSNKAGKKKWFEPEKDRIVVLDLESSEDESITRSPRRRRSAFSLATSTSTPSSPQKENPAGRPRSQTDADGTEYVINPALLSHLSPTNTVGKPIIPREDDPGKAIVLFRPAPWGSGAPTLGSESGSPTAETQHESRAEEDEVIEMEASPLMEDEDAMDVDS